MTMPDFGRPPDLNRPPSYGGYRSTPVGYLQPVRGWAVTAQVLLAGCAVLEATSIWALTRRISLADRLLANPGSVTYDQARNADELISHLAWGNVAAFAVTGLAFLVWFYRARHNVEVYGERYQRRGPGWAIGGWFCPVVNLWFPFQIAHDVLRDSEGAESSGRAGVLRWWWAAWLLGAFLGFIVRVNRVHKLSDVSSHDGLLIALSGAEAITALLAILVVGRITAAQERSNASRV